MCFVAPYIFSVTPNFVSTDGSTLVTVTGLNFESDKYFTYMNVAQQEIEVCCSICNNLSKNF